MARLQGKTAIVTGAGGGIGGAICRRFAREAATVVCVDIDHASVVRTVADVRAGGGQAVALTADVAEEAQIRLADL